MVSSLYSDPENVGISHKRYRNRVFFVVAGITVFCNVRLAGIATHTPRLGTRIDDNVLEHR